MGYINSQVRYKMKLNMKTAAKYNSVSVLSLENMVTELSKMND